MLQLGDVGLGNVLLLLVAVENCRAVLAPGVGALPIELRRVVSDGEEDLEKLAIGDPRRVVGDLDRFGVTGFAAADEFILGGGSRASRVARGRCLDTFDVLEDGLDSPETPAGEDGGLVSRGASWLTSPMP